MRPVQPVEIGSYILCVCGHYTHEHYPQEHGQSYRSRRVNEIVTCLGGEVIAHWARVYKVKTTRAKNWRLTDLEEIVRGKSGKDVRGFAKRSLTMKLGAAGLRRSDVIRALGAVKFLLDAHGPDFFRVLHDVIEEEREFEF